MIIRILLEALLDVGLGEAEPGSVRYYVVV